MTVLLGLGLVLVGIMLDRLWLWARAADRENTATFGVREAEGEVKGEIAARRRRAEEQMRRLAQRGRL